MPSPHRRQPVHRHRNAEAIKPMKILKGKLAIFGMRISKKLSVTIAAAAAVWIAAKTSLPEAEVADVLRKLLDLIMLYVLGQSGVDAAERIGAKRAETTQPAPKAIPIEE